MRVRCSKLAGASARLGSASASVLAALALVLASALVASGCMQKPPTVKMAYLKVVAEPPAATVYIGDRFVGTARLLAKSPKALPPGVKFMTFKAQGFFPHDLRLDLPAGETTVKVKLRPIPP
jgi:hypothetical protein